MKEIDDAFEEYSRNVERAYEKLRIAHHRDVRTFTTMALLFGGAPIIAVLSMEAAEHVHPWIGIAFLIVIAAVLGSGGFYVLWKRK